MLLKRSLAILMLSIAIVALLIYVVSTNETFCVDASINEFGDEKKQGSISEALLPMTESKDEPKWVGESLELEPNETETTVEPTTAVPTTTEVVREVLNAYIGVFEGPSGLESYYNLDMSGVIEIMRDLGYDYKFSIREEDGVKMFGPYIMCAANLELRPIGTIVETSLGLAIVCDTGKFAEYNPTQIDIATNW